MHQGGAPRRTRETRKIGAQEYIPAGSADQGKAAGAPLRERDQGRYGTQEHLLNAGCEMPGKATGLYGRQAH